MIFKNLTPHPITLRSASGDIVVPPEAIPARVEVLAGAERRIEGCPLPILPAPTYGPVTALPEAVPGVLLIVSGLVLSRVLRGDVFGPGTGPNDGAIRNEKGHIVAVTRLISSLH